jgi:RHS repeat-associated protein
VDGYSYTYDQSGNRLSRANLTDAALSESYTHDGLDRLTSVVRNGTETEQWTLDSLGNFMDSSANGVSQSRTTDASNEIQTITQGGTANTQGYDAAGNMTTIADPNNPNGTLTCTFDAWDRLTEVQDSSGNIIAQYQYDGAGRLVEELTNFTGSVPGTVTYSFYDGQNAIETRQGTVSGNSIPAASTLSPQYQYVFSPLSGKTPILRDSTFVGGAATSAGRLYYTSDANTNVTGLINASGQVIERYVYSAYGNVTFCDASWAPLTSGGTNTTTTPGIPSAVGNTTLYASMVLDPSTGLFYDRARWYDASVSTFVSQDPAMADENLYRYCGNDPVVFTDALGLATTVERVGSETVGQDKPMYTFYVMITSEPLTRTAQVCDENAAFVEQLPDGSRKAGKFHSIVIDPFTFGASNTDNPTTLLDGTVIKHKANQIIDLKKFSVPIVLDTRQPNRKLCKVVDKETCTLYAIKDVKGNPTAATGFGSLVNGGTTIIATLNPYGKKEPRPTGSATITSELLHYSYTYTWKVDNAGKRVGTLELEGIKEPQASK